MNTAGRRPRAARATAVRGTEGFVADKTSDDYDADVLLRSGVERRLEIAGEATSVLRKVDPDTAAIGLRDVLIHGHAEVNNLTVWRRATEDLADVRPLVDAFLDEAGPPPTSPLQT